MIASRASRGLAVGALVVGLLILAGTAAAAVPREAIDRTVAAGTAWLREQQLGNGLIRGFDGDWATTTLAAAGVNAADVRGPAAQRSLQDYWAIAYAEPEWSELPSQVGPGQIGKAALIAWSAGLQPTRIAAGANLAADLASTYDPSTGAFAGTRDTNALGFALLAMPYLGLPGGIVGRATQAVLENQHPDGGWTYEAGGSGPGDVDMTGAALAMVCSNGYGPGDPRVAAGLRFLREHENSSTGAIESDSVGVAKVNAPTLAWALIGIQACGEDPQGPAWTTPSGANPVEFGLSLAIASGPQAGAIRYEPASTPTDGRNVNATEALVRALAGKLFSADPPPREDPALPAVRPAPAVAPGTVVPIALTIEGAPGPARMCAVRVADGTPLVEALRVAEAASVPPGCVFGLGTQGPWVTALDGAAAPDPSGGWVFSRPGSAEHRVGAQPVGFGDVVRLRLAPGPLPGGLEASTANLDFGALTAGGESTRTVTIGAAFAPVQVDSLAISGSGAFAVGGGCAGRTLAAGASCTATVSYAPRAAGSDRATLTVNAADADEPSVAVALVGSASAAPVAPPPAAARPPRIGARHGIVKVGRGRVAVLATLVCPPGAPCAVRAPRRVRLKLAGRSFRVAVLAPKAIPAGGRARLRLRLGRPAARALRGHTAAVRLRVRVASPAGVARGDLRLRLRA